MMNSYIDNGKRRSNSKYVLNTTKSDREHKLQQVQCDDCKRMVGHHAKRMPGCSASSAQQSMSRTGLGHTTNLSEFRADCRDHAAGRPAQSLERHQQTGYAKKHKHIYIHHSIYLSPPHWRLKTSWTQQWSIRHLLRLCTHLYISTANYSTNVQSSHRLGSQGMACR